MIIFNEKTKTLPKLGFGSLTRRIVDTLFNLVLNPGPAAQGVEPASPSSAQDAPIAEEHGVHGQAEQGDGTKTPELLFPSEITCLCEQFLPRNCAFASHSDELLGATERKKDAFEAKPEHRGGGGMGKGGGNPLRGEGESRILPDRRKHSRFISLLFCQRENAIKISSLPSEFSTRIPLISGEAIKVKLKLFNRFPISAQNIGHKIDAHLVLWVRGVRSPPLQ